MRHSDGDVRPLVLIRYFARLGTRYTGSALDIYERVLISLIQKADGRLAGELENGMRRTVVVHSRYAWRCHRTKAAIEGEQGLLIVTIEQLVARLAGGFLQFIDPNDLKTAVVAAVAEPLGGHCQVNRL